MLKVIHHAPQQLEKMLPCRLAKKKPLHEVLAAAINCLKMWNALPRNLEAMTINVGSSSTPKVCRIKVVDLRLVKLSEESSRLSREVEDCGRIVAFLKSRGRSHISRNRTWGLS